jgi:hypothetical protein
MRGKLDSEEEARSFRLVAAPYVTVDTGTGLVHTAPGHGEDDFVTGKNENLPILSPVDEAGRFTTAEKYRGKKVLEANKERRRPPGSRRAPRPRRKLPARVPALLALQEAGHLPGDRAVVRPAG